jgi:hypothetical protein
LALASRTAWVVAVVVRVGAPVVVVSCWPAAAVVVGGAELPPLQPATTAARHTAAATATVRRGRGGWVMGGTVAPG